MIFIERHLKFIKKLILSAEEKDNLIIKLKSLNDSDNKIKQTKKCFSKSNDAFLVNDMLSCRDDVRRRKMQGLLKSIHEKNQQIEILKNEITDLKSKTNLHGSTSDLNSSSCNSISNSNNNNNNQYSVKNLIELLEKEIEIYKKLNLKNE